MYSSSTASRRVATISMDAPSSSRRRDERTANGPLTTERAQIDQIRSMLLKTQSRLARDNAQATSQHGYNSSRAAPMSTTVTSSRYVSSQRHTQSRSTVHTATMSHVGSTKHYFPPDYTSTRQRPVPSVYLEDLSMSVVENDQPPPTSRAPTSYAPGGGRVPPTSSASTYYTSADREGRSRSTTTSTSRHHPHHQQQHHTSTVSSSPDHHHHHQQQHERSTSHHHHHHHASTTSSTMRADRTPPSGHPRSVRYQKSGSDSDESPPRVPPPPPSSRGILKYSTASMVDYSTHHESVPASPEGSRPPSSSTRQPIGPSGQPERSALKPTERVYSGSESESMDDQYVAPPPPSSSRVRFQDELLLLHHYDDDTPTPLSFHCPPLAEEDEEYNTDDDDEPHEQLEPMVDIKHPTVETQPSAKPSSSSPPSPASPEPTKKMRPTEAEAEPSRRRRGSRTPPPLSPVASSAHTRKSLTEQPPLSAINFSVFDNFDLRERRASREKRPSNADADVDVDALTNSALESPVAKPTATTETPQRARRSSSGDNASRAGLLTLSSSPIAVHEPRGFSRPSVASRDEEDLEDDDVPSHPPMAMVLDNEEQAKPSPSSSSGDYSDARAFAEDEEADDDAAAVVLEMQSQEKPVINGGAASSLSPPFPPPSDAPHYKNFWEGSSESEAEEEVEVEPKPAGKNTEAEVARPKPTADTTSPPPLPTEAPPATMSPVRASTTASSVAAALGPRSPPSRKPMPMSQSLMMMAPPPSTVTPRRHMPPPHSTRIPPSPATARPTVTRPPPSSIHSTHTRVPRAPMTVDGSAFVPRRLRSKTPITSLPRGSKAMPPSIGALSGLASGPVTFEINEQSFYEITWEEGEFGFSFQRVYLEEDGDGDSRLMFLRMLLNTERGTCPSFKHVHVGDVLIQIGDQRVCDLRLDRYGSGGASLTKLFTNLRAQTPLRLVFQRMDPTSWDGGVEL